MAEYEFTAEENRQIDQVRRKLLHVALLFLVLGALQLVESFTLADPTGRWISLGSAFNPKYRRVPWGRVLPVSTTMRSSNGWWTPRS